MTPQTNVPNSILFFYLPDCPLFPACIMPLIEPGTHFPVYSITYFRPQNVIGLLGTTADDGERGVSNVYKGRVRMTQ